MRRPLIGVGVFVERDGKFLFGKRKGSYGEGTWSLPGGHLEWMETPKDSCRREALEETGLKIYNLEKVTFENVFFSEDHHYVTLFYHTKDFVGYLENKEPEKCEGWEWFSLDEVPDPLFGGLKNAIETFKILRS